VSVVRRENTPMVRRTAVFILTVLVLAAAAATSAFAGKTTSTSSITIASIDGTMMLASTASPSPKLGDTIKFATTVAPLAGWEYPMVALTCYQDVNGDGVVDTSISGPDIVFGQLETPDAYFELGGSSIWPNRGGGDAVCRADLDAYGWKGGKESARVLATTANWVAAG
jgi:hypothetical protein